MRVALMAGPMVVRKADSTAEMKVVDWVALSVVQTVECLADPKADQKAECWADSMAGNLAARSVDLRVASTAGCWVAKWVELSVVQMAAYLVGRWVDQKAEWWADSTAESSAARWVGQRAASRADCSVADLVA